MENRKIKSSLSFLVLAIIAIVVGFALAPRVQATSSAETFAAMDQEEIETARNLVAMARHGHLDVVSNFDFPDRLTTDEELEAIGTTRTEIRLIHQRNRVRLLADAMRRLRAGEVEDKAQSAGWIVNQLDDFDLQPEDIATSWQELHDLGAPTQYRRLGDRGNYLHTLVGG